MALESLCKDVILVKVMELPNGLDALEDALRAEGNVRLSHPTVREDLDASGRERVFEVALRPRGRPGRRDGSVGPRGEKPHSFGDDERVAA